MQDLKFAREYRIISGEYYGEIKPSNKGVEEIKKEAKELMKKDKSLTPESAINKVVIKKITEIKHNFLNKLKKKENKK